jgi:hypothetical protein
MESTTVTARVLAEKRRLWLPLAVALALNIGVYAAVVYPMSRRVAAATDQWNRAARNLGAAQRSFNDAKEAVTSKDRADKDLTTFYTRVLPTDITGARRMTYLKLSKLAEEVNLKLERQDQQEESDRDSYLQKLRTKMILSGEYADVRRFIYQLETTPEFVVIEDVALAQAEERNAPLVLTLEVATYYRAGGDGT